MHRTRAFTVGFVLSSILGFLEMASLLAIGVDDAPPTWVLVVGFGLGSITVVGAFFAWSGHRRGLLAVVGSRAGSLVLAAPAFFLTEMSTVGAAFAVGSDGVTILALALLLPTVRGRQPSTASHRG
ncbi:hypothetical protein B4N89_39755 [Embleya scabrispora]|uniref:Uncharacterized protein n=1 Tax=Embleya scabrispora TaxID=159449 RepID=A0A1T3NN61_9ACTN|nr:hypothetical protein [Embleya scabrispora]OPC78307.1 hypothetical protein B4N89_39755 [Embleya scabrispora]